jgi:hypothetical protein
MIRRLLHRRCHTPAALTTEDRAAFDACRAMLAALHALEPWTPGSNQDAAVRVGAFVERAHPRPGDDHGPDLIAVALIHPDTPHTAACAPRYTTKGWLRCPTNTILGAWNPAYAILTHAAAGRDLPADVGMTPAHYGVHIEARRPDGTGHTLLRLGPYTQTRHANHDTARLNTELDQTKELLPGYTVRAVGAPFDVSDHASYHDPHQADATVLLAAAAEEAGIA